MPMNYASSRINQAIQGSQRQRLFICIDGPAGSGKTTLAEDISLDLPSVEVVHMDDLYEGWHNALSPQLYERVRTQIVAPFLQGRAMRYQKWDWLASAWGKAIDIPVPAILVLEGVGAAAAPLRALADITIFLEIDQSIGAQRVLARDGAEVSVYLSDWLEQQRMHFETDDTQMHCQLVFAAEA